MGDGSIAVSFCSCCCNIDFLEFHTCTSNGIGPLLDSIIGSSTSRGTTAMSWKSSTPRQAAPIRVDSWVGVGVCEGGCEGCLCKDF